MTDVTDLIISKPQLALDQAQAFLELVEMTKRVEQAWSAVSKVMIPAYEQGKIDKTMKGDWGSVTVGERKTWKVAHELPEEYYKKALDTTKLTYMYDHDEAFPAGVDFNVTPYITKRLK
jgi:hypothetical protein